MRKAGVRISYCGRGLPGATATLDSMAPSSSSISTSRRPESPSVAARRKAKRVFSVTNRREPSAKRNERLAPAGTRTIWPARSTSPATSGCSPIASLSARTTSPLTSRMSATIGSGRSRRKGMRTRVPVGMRYGSAIPFVFCTSGQSAGLAKFCSAIPIKVSPGRITYTHSSARAIAPLVKAPAQRKPANTRRKTTPKILVVESFICAPR